MTEHDGPVRVSRFEWERLMMMSVPHPQNLKLLPIGIFMSADGGSARPGNNGLAMFGPHEKTWAKLLRWAVGEGWLLLVQRGGARRGPNGTTVVRASVYAASVPQLVWKRREEILGAPPFKAADSLNGAPKGSPEALKGAPDGSLVDDPSLNGAPMAPFNGADPSLKGASRDSLPDPLKGAPDGFEGSDPSFEGSVSRFEGSAQTLPHHVVTPSTPTTTTSAASGSQQKQQQPKPSKTAPATGPIPGDEPHLADVDAICNHLADVIQKATGERPKITKREWRDPARLMLDADGRALEQVLTAIDWAHADGFWQGVVTNPKVLRKNYMTLRQKAVAERRKGAWRNPDDQDDYDADLVEDRNTQDDYEGDLIR